MIEQTVKIPKDLDAFYNLPREPDNSSDLLLITVDGKGIVMRGFGILVESGLLVPPCGKQRG